MNAWGAGESWLRPSARRMVSVASLGVASKSQHIDLAEARFL
jgi:hypothetical protein